MDVVEPVEHPAKYSKEIMQSLEHLITDYVTKVRYMWDTRILDPMAGVGTIHNLSLPECITTVGLELEPEWADQHPQNVCGDARAMPFDNGEFDMVVFSPPYANRMADQFVAKDTSKRITYMHFLGRRLDERSAAGMHWGDDYRRTMRQVLIECKRVCLGPIIINVSDFMRTVSATRKRVGGQEQVPVVDFYRDTMFDLGYRVTLDLSIPTKRMKFGANGKLRVDCEHILQFEKRRF